MISFPIRDHRVLGQHLRGAYATRAWGMKVTHVLGWIEPSDSMIGSACIGRRPFRSRIECRITGSVREGRVSGGLRILRGPRRSHLENTSLTPSLFSATRTGGEELMRVWSR
ncbi:hypothetical protein PISMIDRAFT_316341 [Pisolithus microcarpus 441]|uniref:Unplaced genomic scaffold scaffold_20, whole genome shotgun sequence n=1 Tax=Pisolithus microcarpus 441 TaxID=765257 RepID=A0A0C9ZJ88_9AGAM|nr:hypothetical protein PISMIDRAFT_316341 [Pisolithus microcarpus 441]